MIVQVLLSGHLLDLKMSKTAAQRLATAFACGALGVLAAMAPAGAATEESTARAYREALGRLGAGDHEAALAALGKLEAAALGSEPSVSDVEALWRGELQVIRDVLPERTEVLVPILMLHHDAYLAYRDQHRPLLARHARVAAEELTDVYARRADTAEAKSIASQVLTSLAGYVLDAAMIGPGGNLLLRALDYDPRNTDAMLGLGAIEEKVGRYPQAIERLRRLLEVDPEHAEGRLRLALNLRRSGATEEADRLLGELARSRTDWLGQLACEESAAVLADQAKLTEAIAFLRGAVERFPSSERLLVHLSYLLERSGHREAALAAAERAGAGGAAHSQEHTPRVLNTRWPPRELACLRRALGEAASQRLPIVAAALGAAAENPQ